MLAASSSLWAVECAEVVWTPHVLERYSNVYNVCQRVIEHDGKHYVEVKAKLLSLHNHQARLNFKLADGSYDKTFETKALPADFKVIIDGKQVLLSKVELNTDLTVYVPSDRFALVSELAKITTVYEFESEVVPVKNN